MSEELNSQAVTEHQLYLNERDKLIDAARESARTFDQAVLAFGSVVFGASIAFLKDVAPRPQPYTLKWLGISWFLFAFGLLCVMLSFLFSHRACMFEIDSGAKALGNPDFIPTKNHFSTITNLCNYLCVAFLFVGLLVWSVFAFENLTTGDKSLSRPNNPQPGDTEKRGYPPPPPPPRTPPPATPPSPPPQTPQK